MLTSFGSIKSVEKEKEQKKEQEQGHAGRLQLLFEAINTVLMENSYRVYIEGYSYRAEFKLPVGLELQMLKNQKIQSSESKYIGDGILVHTFFILGKSDSFEVMYEPISRPRL